MKIAADSMPCHLPILVYSTARCLERSLNTSKVPSHLPQGFFFGNFDDLRAWDSILMQDGPQQDVGDEILLFKDPCVALKVLIMIAFELV